MEEPRVIQADYANWRTVAGRKVLQLTFEVPIEQTADVMNKLGVPMPGESKWCAIALLVNNGSANENDAGQHRNVPKSSGPSEALDGHHGPIPSRTPASIAVVGISETHDRRKFSELPLPQQAGIRCQDKDFHWFLMDEYPTIAARSTEPKGIVCELCGVDTRSGLVHGEASGDMWRSIEARYQSWRTDRQFAEAKR
jgi:hypothetical protein